MQQKEYTIKEFARLKRLRDATVRQMCHGYKTNNGRNRSHLPAGWTARRDDGVTGRYLISSTAAKPSQEELNAQVEPAVDKEIRRTYLKHLLKDEVENWPNWLAKEMARFWKEGLRSKFGGESPLLADPAVLLGVIEDSYSSAVGDGHTVKIELTFKRTGDWDVKPLEPVDSAKELFAIRRHPLSELEQLFTPKWWREIMSVKDGKQRTTSLGSYSEEFTSSPMWPCFASLCLECGCQKKDTPRRRSFCSKQCQDAHSKWVARTAKKCASEDDAYTASMRKLQDIKPVIQQFEAISD
jgi:hypothetical protein